MATAERILTDEMIEAIKAYFPRYPTRQAVTLPALHIVNERLRYVPLAGGGRDRRVARSWRRPRCRTRCRFTASSSKTSRTARRGPGSAARSVAPCAAARKCSTTCATRPAFDPGETTADGKLTLEFAECLGACEFAPCMLAGKTLYKDLTKESADEFLQK